MFIKDLLNYQAILINMIALVTVNLPQLALRGKAIPWFPTKPIVIVNKENKNKKKEQ